MIAPQQHTLPGSLCLAPLPTLRSCLACLSPLPLLLALLACLPCLPALLLCLLYALVFFLCLPCLPCLPRPPCLPSLPPSLASIPCLYSLPPWPLLYSWRPCLSKSLTCTPCTPFLFHLPFTSTLPANTLSFLLTPWTHSRFSASLSCDQFAFLVYLLSSWAPFVFVCLPCAFAYFLVNSIIPRFLALGFCSSVLFPHVAFRYCRTL
jgi:hypothetical protein